MLSRSISRSMAVVVGVFVVSPVVVASDVRGTLQGVDTLTPTAVPDAPRFRGSYWDSPNGVLRPSSAHASPEWDVAVVLTGAGIAEANQPVNVRLEGGRCRPGTVVVTPGTVVQIDNRDILGHELYAVPQGGGARVVQAEVTSSGTRRQITFPTAGVYELRDVRQPSLRCWVIAGPGQGRVVTTAADGSFTLTGLADGDYTARGYFEGAERGSVDVHTPSHEGPLSLVLTAPGATTPPADHGDARHGRER